MGISDFIAKHAYRGEKIASYRGSVRRRLLKAYVIYQANVWINGTLNAKNKIVDGFVIYVRKPPAKA